MYFNIAENPNQTLFTLDDRDTIELAHRLLFTTHSTSFKKLFKKGWKATEKMSCVENAIKEKLERMVLGDYRNFDEDNLESSLAYIHHLAQLAGFKLPKTPKLVLSINPTQYRAIEHFIYKQSAQYRTHTHQTGQFNFHGLLWMIVNYLLANDTLMNGIENPKMNGILQTILETKPTSYWLNGFPYDLLVHDRIEILKKSYRQWKTYKDYCSTDLGCSNESADESIFQIVSLA